MTPFSTDFSTTAALTEAFAHYSKPSNLTPELSCSLRWRQGKLWVSAFSPAGSIPLPALASEEWFRACLMRSQAQAVIIDPELGDASINLWLKACEEAGKPVYLKIPSMASLPQKKKPLAWWVKGVCDRIVAALFLLLLSPLLPIFIGLMKLQGNSPVFDTRWHIGERGKLFRVLRCHVNEADVCKTKANALTSVVEKVLKSTLNAALQLLNILRGEMSLVGPRALTVHEALEVTSDLRHRLNALPGITGTWQLKQLEQQNHFVVSQQDLKYLEEWTVLHDLKLLLLSMSRVLTRAAYF
ncbi:MAG TPA: heterocyst development glycosyltransferase HepC [Trichocoleus sp.]